MIADLSCHLPLAFFIIDDLFYVALIIASAASSVVSYQGQKTAAKQTELNAEAQQKAIMAERQRKAIEDTENRRRLAQQERRERATQAADLAGTGLDTSTGTPLAIISDTMKAQNERRADMVNNDNLDQWQMLSQGNTILQEGRSRARAMRSEAGASLLSGVAQTAGYGASYASTFAPKKTTTTAPAT